MKETIRGAVAKGLRFIEENLYSEIGVSDVAAYTAYSQFYFSREFTKHTHMSVYDYILRRKLSESYKDLFTRQYRIVDLAFRYGFQSHEVYTRAYRKMFAENPSDSVVYKPLALMAPIDEAYLDFLCGLRVERINNGERNCLFVVDGASDTLDAADDSCLLCLFQPGNLHHCLCLLCGTLQDMAGSALSIPLHGLVHTLRIHSADSSHAFRYYMEHDYDSTALNSNYLLLRNENGMTDILIPAGSKPLNG